MAKEIGNVIRVMLRFSHEGLNFVGYIVSSVGKNPEAANYAHTEINFQG